MQGANLEIGAPGLLFAGLARIVPERLVVDLVVELHFRCLDEGIQGRERSDWRCLLQIGKTALHIRTEDIGDPLRRLEVVDGCLNVVG